MTSPAASLPVGPCPAMNEPSEFRYLGPDLADAFDAAAQSYNSAADAAMKDAARAERAGSDRAHARLDAFQRAEDLAFAAPPDGLAAPLPEPLLDGRGEEAMAAFLGAHAEQDAAEGREPAPEETQVIPAHSEGSDGA